MLLLRKKENNSTKSDIITYILFGHFALFAVSFYLTALINYTYIGCVCIFTNIGFNFAHLKLITKQFL